MKIALVHDHLFQIGGAELVLKNFSEIFPEAPIFTLIYNPKEVKNFLKGKEIRTSFIQNLPFGQKKFKFYLPLMPNAFERFDFSDFEIVLSNTSAFAKGIITKPGTLHICYCHSPTRYLWSDSFEFIHPLERTWFFKNISFFVKTPLRIWDRIAAERVDQFIANSKNVARRIKKYYNKESKVIYPPCQTDRFYISSQVEDYYLIVSRLRPYKKVDLAVEAFNKLKLPLKIIGSGQEEERLKKMANSNIEFLGNLSDKEKAEHLSRCRAFIHPQEEDFGITPLEAMASGRPVIAYGKGGALETIIENKTGVFFKEQTVEALIEAVRRFDYQKFDPETLRNHALKFDSKVFKEKIKEYINEVFYLSNRTY